MEDHKTLLRQICDEIRFGVVFTDFLMTIYVLWLIITNTSSWIPGAILGYSIFGAFELFRASKLFNLCIIHKLMLVHSGLVYSCCIYQAHYGFEEQLVYMRWLMFLSGLYLILWLCIKKKFWIK